MGLRNADFAPGKQPGVADRSNTERNGQLDSEFGNPGYQGDTPGGQDQADRRTSLGTSAEGGGDYSSAAAEKRQRYDEWANLHGKEAGPGGGTHYINPGSADYGGRDGVGFYSAQGEAGGHENDAAQARNGAALGQSVSNMTGNRGPLQENVDLTNRDIRSRDAQMGSLGLSRQAAMGQAPSEAAYQTRLGMNDVMAGRAGAMGSAHNLSGLNGAQMGSMASAGGQASGVAMGGGLGRSREISDAIGMYGNQAGQVRDQDLARLSQNTQNSEFSAKSNDDWKLGNASLAAQQANLGTAQGSTDLGWMGEQMKPADKQFQYDQEMAASEAGADADRAGASIAASRESAAHTRGLVNGVATAGLTAVGSVFGGPVGGAAGAAAGAAFGSATRDWDW